MNTLSCIVGGGGGGGGGGGECLRVGLHFEEEKRMNAIEGISYFQATKIIKEY